MRLDQLDNVNKEADELRRIKRILGVLHKKEVFICVERANNGYNFANHTHEILDPEDKHAIADILMRREVKLTETLRKRGVVV